MRDERTTYNLASASNAAKRASQLDSAFRNERLNRNSDPEVEPSSKEDLKRKLNSLEAAYDEQYAINNQLKKTHEERLSAVHKEWEQKYTALEQKHEDLANRFGQLDLKYANDAKAWNKSYFSMKNRAEDDTARLREAKNRHNEERQCLQAKLDELNALHIRSVNSVGTGLEPITGKTFEDKFRSLQDKVGDWSRKISKQTGEGHHTAVIDLTSAHRIPARVSDINQLRPTKLIETAAWDFLEDTVLSRWLPGFGEDDQERLNEMLRAIQLGGMSPGPPFVYRI